MPSAPSFSEKFKKILTQAVAVNSQPTEASFPELTDVLIWFRALLGLACGLYFGLQGIRSGAAPVQVVNVVVFIPFMYGRFFLGVPAEEFASQLVFSGTFNALALFLLIWVYLFTVEHEGVEAQLVALLVANATAADPVAAAQTAETTVPPVVDDQEF